MGIEIKIDDVTKSALFRRGSLRIHESLSGRGTARFELVDVAQDYRPTVGHTVEVLEGSTRLFRGTVDSFEEREPIAGGVNRVFVTAVDFNQLTNRFLVANSYTDQTLSSIVEDIVQVQTKLSVEGVTVATIANDPTLNFATFNYWTARRCFDELARETAFSWNIDGDKVLTFSALGSVSSGVTFSNSNGADYSSIRVKKTRENYRNRQYLRGGNQDTNAGRVDSFSGDGNRTAFVLDYEVSPTTPPTIKVNDVAQDVGIRAVDDEDSLHWLYAVGDNEITQAGDADALESSDILEVTYTGQFPTITENELPAEIESRKNIEGGSGVYERMEIDEDVHGADLSIDRTQGLLRRFGAINHECAIEAFDGTPNIGETIVVDLSQHGLSALEFLIETKSTTDLNADTSTKKYSYKASSPIEEFESWTEFFSKWIEQGKRTIVGRENELLLLARGEVETITTTDAATTTTDTSELIDTDADPFTTMSIGSHAGTPAALIGACRLVKT